MKILLLGNPIFKNELSALGHTALSCGVTPDRDIVVHPEEYSIANLLSGFAPAEKPDVCLFIEELGRRVFPDGLEKCPVPLVFYSIDTHLNFFWVRHFASVCTAVITTQRDYVREFKKGGTRSFWLPWSNDPDAYSDYGVERDLDIAFVGAITPQRQRRKNLLDLLSNRFRVSVLGSPSPDRMYSPAEISGVFSRSKIVVNEAISGEVNFRIFEGMATGAMMLTEKVGNGLDELFEDGKHLVTFTPLDIMEKTAYYLENHQDRHGIAECGKKEVSEKHTRAARSAQLAGILEECAGSAVTSTAKAKSRLGRAFSMMVRSGQTADERNLSRAVKLLVQACESEPGDGELFLNLAEFEAVLGGTERARVNYARAWEAGERGFRLSSQWGIDLLDDGKAVEAAVFFRNITTLDLPGEIRAGLASALDKPIPSEELYYWLARAAETTEERFRPGFFPRNEVCAPLTGVDFLNRESRLGPARAKSQEERADIYYREGVYFPAAQVYLRALQLAPMSAGLYRKAALALFHSFQLSDALALAQAALEFDPTPENESLVKTLERVSLGPG